MPPARFVLHVCRAAGLGFYCLARMAPAGQPSQPLVFKTQHPMAKTQRYQIYINTGHLVQSKFQVNNKLLFSISMSHTILSGSNGSTFSVWMIPGISFRHWPDYMTVSTATSCCYYQACWWPKALMERD